MNYLIVEVYDHYESNGATITELALQDEEGINISYTIESVFDSETNSNPDYWNSTIWGKSKLQDKNTTYTNNGTGATSSALFLYSGGAKPNTGKFARFAIKPEANKIIKVIALAAGSPEGRIPHYVRIYECESYTESNIKNRVNDGLVLVDEWVFTENHRNVVRYFRNIEIEKLLIRKENEIYTIKNNEIVKINSELNDNLFLQEGFLVASISKKEIIKKLGNNIEILSYKKNDGNIDVTIYYKGIIYYPDEDTYKGKGTLITEIEDIPNEAKYLMISAISNQCSFAYSFNEDGSWHTAVTDNLIDISGFTKNKLQIIIRLSSEDSSLSALAYQWI